MTTDLDALIADARFRAGRDTGLSDHLLRELSDALESTLAELRQERKRADEAEKARDVFHDKGLAAIHAMNAAQDALSRAEETIEKVRAARSNHPECDVHDDDDPVTCGWKRAVQDIDAALTDHDNQKETSRG